MTLKRKIIGLHLGEILYVILTYTLVIKSCNVPISTTRSKRAAPKAVVLSVSASHTANSFDVAVPTGAGLSTGADFPLTTKRAIAVGTSCTPFSTDISFNLVTPGKICCCFGVAGKDVSGAVRIPRDKSCVLRVEGGTRMRMRITNFIGC